MIPDSPPPVTFNFAREESSSYFRRYYAQVGGGAAYLVGYSAFQAKTPPELLNCEEVHLQRAKLSLVLGKLVSNSITPHLSVLFPPVIHLHRASGLYLSPRTLQPHAAPVRKSLPINARMRGDTTRDMRQEKEARQEREARQARQRNKARHTQEEVVTRQ